MARAIPGRTRPKGVAQVNRATSLTKGLCFFSPFSEGVQTFREAVTGIRGNVDTGVSSDFSFVSDVKSQTKFLKCNTNSGALNWPNHSQFIRPSNAVTMVIRANFNTLPAAYNGGFAFLGFSFASVQIMNTGPSSLYFFTSPASNTTGNDVAPSLDIPLNQFITVIGRWYQNGVINLQAYDDDGRLLGQTQAAAQNNALIADTNNPFVLYGIGAVTTDYLAMFSRYISDNECTQLAREPKILAGSKGYTTPRGVMSGLGTTKFTTNNVSTTPTVTKNIRKTFATSASTQANSITGHSYFLTLSTTASSSASAPKKVNKSLAVSAPSTPQQTAGSPWGKGLFANIVTVTTLNKNVSKALAVSEGTTALQVHPQNKQFSTTASSLAIKGPTIISKSLLASTTSTPTVAKSIPKTAKANAASTATQANTKAYLRSFLATATTSASLTRKVNKALATTAASAATSPKALRKTFAVSAPSIITVSHPQGKILTVAVTSSAVSKRLLNKLCAVTNTPSATRGPTAYSLHRPVNEIAQPSLAKSYAKVFSTTAGNLSAMHFPVSAKLFSTTASSLASSFKKVNKALSTNAPSTVIFTKSNRWSRLLATTSPVVPASSKGISKKLFQTVSTSPTRVNLFSGNVKLAPLVALAGNLASSWQIRSPAQGRDLNYKVYKGLAIAAKHVGQPCSIYRPVQSSMRAALDPANYRERIDASFAADYSYSKPVKYATATWTAVIDGRHTQPGDYIVGPRADMSDIYFIAQQTMMLPILAVKCNRTLTVKRASNTDSFGYSPAYRGDDVRFESLILTGFPASVLEGTKGEKGDANLPEDIRLPWWRIMLPYCGIQIQTMDLLYDDLGNRYIVSSTELTELGWRITAMQEST